MSIFSTALFWGAWLLWAGAFLRVKKAGSAVQVDRRARLGILLEAFGFFIVFFGARWEQVPGLWRIAFAIVFYAVAWWLAYAAVVALGRQWRVDAGLSANHQLVRQGPYRVVRHPIYASMLGMLLGSGCLVAPWWKLGIAVPLFIAGTEVRVRIEDRLLESRFGEEFREYRRNVPAYLPGLR